MGIVTNLEQNHKKLEFARKGMEVCIKIENTPGETPKLYGRHFTHEDLLVSRVTNSNPSLNNNNRSEIPQKFPKNQFIYQFFIKVMMIHLKNLSNSSWKIGKYSINSFNLIDLENGLIIKCSLASKLPLKFENWKMPMRSAGWLNSF